MVVSFSSELLQEGFSSLIYKWKSQIWNRVYRHAVHLEYIVSFSSELLQERGREELEESMQEENGKLFFCPGLTKTILNQIFRDGSNGDSGSRKDYELFNFNFFWTFVYYLKVFLNLMYVILIHLELSLNNLVSSLHHNYFHQISRDGDNSNNGSHEDNKLFKLNCNGTSNFILYR